MATTRKFITKNGLDAGSTAIDNAGTNGSSLAVSGAFAVTLTASGATNVTLPTTGTLLTSASSLSAASLTGVIPDAQISGAYTGITALTLNATNEQMVLGKFAGAPISTLLGGSTTGALIQGAQQAHIAIQIRANDDLDSFAVVANSTATHTDPPDTLAFRVQRTGNISWAGTATGNGSLITALNATQLTTGTVPDGRISGSYTGLTNLTGTGTVDFSKFLGNSADTAAAPSFSWTGDDDTGVFTPAANTLAFSTGGTERVRVDSSGFLRPYAGLLIGTNVAGTTTWIRKYAGGYSVTHTPSTARRIGQVTFGAASQHLTITGHFTVSSGATSAKADVYMHLRSNTLPSKGYVFEKVITTNGYTTLDVQLYEDTASGLFVLTYTGATQVQSVYWELTVAERGNYNYWQQVETETAQTLTGLTLQAPTTTAVSKSNGTFTLDGTITATSLVGPLTGNASTATALATGRTISLTGDATGTSAAFDGTAPASIAVTLPNVATAGTYRSVTVNAKGLVTAGTNPTTLAGYGITDAQALDTDLTAIGALAGTSGLLRKTAANTWSLDTSTFLTGNQTITLSGDISGTGTTAITGTLATVNANVGSFGSASSVATFTVNGKGLITAAGSTAIQIAETQITDGSVLARLAGNETVTGTWTFNNNTSVPLIPTADAHAASKQYVDGLISGITDFKQSVRVATTANITLSGTQTIDGVAVIAGDRVLVKNQTTASQNGLYVVAAGAWARSADADNSPANEVTSGLYVFVEEGSQAGNSGWILGTPNPITLGTTALTFVQFTGLGQVTAGAGLTKSGNTIDVGTASTARIVVNADDIDLATVTDAGTGTFLKFTRDTYGRVSGTTAVVAADITGLVNSTYVTLGTTQTITGTKTFSAATGFANGTALLPSITFSGDLNTGIFWRSADVLAITTGGTEAAYFDASGNTNIVGNIGVKDATPSSSVAINSSISLSANAGRYGVQNLLAISNETLTADRTSFGAFNRINVDLQNSVAFSLVAEGARNLAQTGVAGGNSVDGEGTLTGANNYALHQSADATFTRIETMYGATNTSQVSGATAIGDNAYGTLSRAIASAAGSSITTAFGVRSQIQSSNATSSIGTGYLYYGDVTATGTFTNRYGVYIASNVINYMNGGLQIGGTAATGASSAGLGVGVAAPGTAGVILASSSVQVSNASAGAVTLGRFSSSNSNARLDIATSSAGDAIEQIVSDNSAGATKSLVWKLGTTERFRVNGSGAFGIGGANFGSSGQVFVSGGSAAAPAWATLTLSNLPGAFVKMAVRAATTANITLSGTQTIDGVVLVAGNRVLVKNQTTTAQNGIYDVAAGAWTRSVDAATSTDIAGALVGVDEGTTQKGHLFTTYFGSTDVLGTTAMLWYEIADVDSSQNFSNKVINSSSIGATTRSTGAFTTLTSNGTTTMTAGTASTSTTTGTLIVTGGVGVSGALYAGTLFGNGGGLTSLNASNLSSGAVPNAQISGSYTGLTNLTGTGDVDFSRFLGNGTDTAAAPSFTWTGDTNTGIYTPGADQLAVTTGGAQRGLFSSAGFTSTGFVTAEGGVRFGSADNPTYGMTLDFGSDVAGTWRKIVGATLQDITFSTHGFAIDVTDPKTNHATSSSVNSVITERYYVAMVRTESTTLGTPDACYVTGPGNRIRAIKTALGSYEIQIQNEGQFREYRVLISTYATNGSHTITYFPGTTAGTATATYNATVGTAEDVFQEVRVTGTSASTTTTTGALTVAGGVGVVGAINAGSMTLGSALPVASGGTAATTAAGARTNLGATTVGANFFTLANPTAITFPRINADNTVSALNATDFRTAIGATGTGSVTSVSVVTANGISGSVATATTTPAITLTLGAITPTSVNVSAGSLGGTAGNTRLVQTLQGTTSNGSLIETFLLREATGTDWTTSSFRIQSRTDATYQAWQQFNGNGNGGGIGWGSGQNASATGVGERMRLDANGRLSLLTGTAATSTTTGTLVVTGGVGVSGAIHAGSLLLDTALAIAEGGTGATTAAAARTNLGATAVGSSVFTATDAAAARTAIGAGTGTVTSVSVTTANGVSGTVATNTTTPAISITLGNITPTQVISSGDVIATNEVVIRGGTTGQEGAQIVMGYGNNLATAITGQANNSWNIDVDVNSAFRIFRQNSGGAVITPIQIAESNGLITTFTDISLGASPNGRIVLTQGSAGSVTGGIDFYSAVGREGYIGRTTSTSSADSGTINYVAGSHVFTGTVQVNDASTVGGVSIGYRTIPVNNKTATYTLAAADTGKSIDTNSGVTVPTGLAAGTTVTIYNNTTGNITITQGASVTLRLAGTATTGNRVLARNGIATIWYRSTTEAIASGAGLT